MSPPFPSWTKTWHTEPYPEISPTRAELSNKGRVVVISGGGSGIGAAIAHAFAASGSESIAIVSRTKSRLDDTKAAVEAKNPRTRVLSVAADTTDEKQLSAAFDEIEAAFGKIDVLVSNSGYSPTTAPVADSGVADWWQGHKTNALGAFLTFREFHKHANQSAFVFHVSSGIAHIPALPFGVSSYASSKAAATRLFDYIAAEYPDYHVVNIQPGVIATDLNKSMPGMDDVNLPGHFIVWLTSPEAAFLKSKFVWANWDVEELKSRKDEILDKETFTIMLSGVSFAA